MEMEEGSRSVYEVTLRAGEKQRTSECLNYDVEETRMYVRIAISKC